MVMFTLGCPKYCKTK